MRLRAPGEWSGAEASESEAAGLVGGCEAGAALRFDCEELLGEGAAAAAVAEAMPALAGVPAVVNKGALWVEWLEKVDEDW